MTPVPSSVGGDGIDTPQPGLKDNPSMNHAERERHRIYLGKVYHYHVHRVSFLTLTGKKRNVLLTFNSKDNAMRLLAPYRDNPRPHTGGDL